MAVKRINGTIVGRFKPYKQSDSDGFLRLVDANGNKLEGIAKKGENHKWASYIIEVLAGVCPNKRILHRSMIEDTVDLDSVDNLDLYEIRCNELEEHDEYGRQFEYQIVAKITRQEFKSDYLGTPKLIVDVINIEEAPTKKKETVNQKKEQEIELE